MSPSRRIPLPITVLLVAAGCQDSGSPGDTPPPYVEAREPCAERDPLRRLLFGDLHVHTANSFDAHIFDVRTTPAQAYAFARGEPVALPPLDAGGAGTRTLRIDRPLDFAAVTDHSEFLGEVEMCSTPGSAIYEGEACRQFRAGGNPEVVRFGTRLTLENFTHDARFCGDDATGCAGAAGQVWREVQHAAAGAYDRTAACRFTSFVAYEYSATPLISTMHRNVIFKNDLVPPPVSFFEQPTPQGLWDELRAACTTGLPGCDVLSIPHNSNESNGRAFFAEYPDADGPDRIAAERRQAQERAAMEPLLEIYQHKGDSECMNGLAGIAGAADEQCDFEKSPRAPFMDCLDGRGSGGAARTGCYSVRDFARGALLAGLREDERLGVNPFALGFIASTDTHNGTPGAVAEDAFAGHRGLDDDTPERRLGAGNLTPGGVVFSPGGLVAVWAEENSRPAIFEALRRRETYGTSGPRIAVRLFGGWGYGAELCRDARLVQAGYDGGVPMGGVLPPLPAGASAPRFVVSALRDPGTGERPGTSLERIQVVKGWLAAGEAHQRVYDVAGTRGSGAVDTATCVTTGSGADSLCAVWVDPDFRPGERAFYYARVLENPSCRWSTFYCHSLAPGDRPAACSDPSVRSTIQERAWTSPIWYRPG